MSLAGPALIGSMLLAVLSTVADYVWFLNIPQHQVSSGMIHGSVLFAALQTHLDGRLDLPKAIGRGLATSIAAGLGFGVVLFQLYRGWPPAEFPAFRHLVAWSMAYLPGLYVLLKK